MSASRAKTASGRRALSLFRALGQLCAKALVDGRVLDLPFSRPFYRLAVGKERDLMLADAIEIDAAMARSLMNLKKVADEKRAIQDRSDLGEQDKRERIERIRVGGQMSFEDMCLPFTLPGHPDIELKVIFERIDEYHWNHALWLLVL